MPLLTETGLERDSVICERDTEMSILCPYLAMIESKEMLKGPLQKPLWSMSLLQRKEKCPFFVLSIDKPFCPINTFLQEGKVQACRGVVGACYKKCPFRVLVCVLCVLFLRERNLKPYASKTVICFYEKDTEMSFLCPYLAMSQRRSKKWCKTVTKY